jgi:hypothetical protein
MKPELENLLKLSGEADRIGNELRDAVKSMRLNPEQSPPLLKLNWCATGHDLVRFVVASCPACAMNKLYQAEWDRANRLLNDRNSAHGALRDLGEVARDRQAQVEGLTRICEASKQKLADTEKVLRERKGRVEELLEANAAQYNQVNEQARRIKELETIVLELSKLAGGGSSREALRSTESITELRKADSAPAPGVLRWRCATPDDSNIRKQSQHVVAGWPHTDQGHFAKVLQQQRPDGSWSDVPFEGEASK